MIFTGLKRKTIQNFFHKELLRSQMKSTDLASGKILKIAVIATEESVIEAAVSSLQKILEVESENFEFIVFKDKLSKIEERPSFFSRRDIDWFGKIKSEELFKFLTKEHDLLINYSKLDNLYINLLVLSSNAKFKVGFADINDNLYNLMISDVNFDMAVFNKELKRYLQILNKI